MRKTMFIYFIGLAIIINFYSNVYAYPDRGCSCSSCHNAYADTCEPTPPPSVNTPPEAVIVFNGPTPHVDDVVQLYGDQSTDADSDDLFYAWSVISPDGTETTFDIVNPTFVADQPGEYDVQLIVFDHADESDPAFLTISTENTPPVADAGEDVEFTAGGSVELDGSGSTDVDSPLLLTYQWSIDTQPTGSNATLIDAISVMPTLTADLPGDYIIELIVNDGSVNSEPDTVTLTAVKAPPTNTRPVADAGQNDSVVVGDPVTLDGSGSSDADGDPLTYQWSITTSPAESSASLSNSSNETASFVADVSGTYVAQLIVHDGTAPSSPDTVTLMATDPPSKDINTRPVADAGQDDAVMVGDTVTLDGSRSSDADGDLLTYTWSFNSIPDGSAAEIAPSGAVTPSFEADMAGIYVVQLIVNDGTDNSEPKTVEVTVSSVDSNGPICGDGVLDADAGEACDDGNNINGDGCAADCITEPPPVIKNPEPPPIVEKPTNPGNGVDDDEDEVDEVEDDDKYKEEEEDDEEDDKYEEDDDDDKRERRYDRKRRFFRSFFRNYFRR